MKTLLNTFAMLVIVLLAVPAYASGGGRVKGTFKFYNRLIHYCPSITESRNCSGSNYNENAHNSYLPVSDMEFDMRVNGVKVATFSTDVSGDYDFNWYYPYSGTPTSAVIEGFMKHKDGRFQVLKQDGSTHRIYTTFSAYYDYVNGGEATGYAQNLGTRYWGTIPRLITYGAAWRTWYYAFKYAGSLLNDFDGLELWVGASSGSGSYSENNFRITIPAWCYAAARMTLRA